MNFDQYRQVIEKFAIYPRDNEEEYLIFGLISEVGEIADLFKRELRDGTPVTDELLVEEIGDSYWYLGRYYDFRGDDSPNENLRYPDLGRARELCRILHGIDVEFSGGIGLVKVYAALQNLLPHGVTLEDCLDANVAKLEKRLAEGKLGKVDGVR